MKKIIVVMAALLLMMSTAAFADSISVVSVVGNTVTFQVQNTGAANRLPLGVDEAPLREIDALVAAWAVRLRVR